MPIHRIRTIYWKYRPAPSRIRDAIAGRTSRGPAIELRRIHGGRKKENHDDRRGPSGGRQPEFAYGGAAGTGGLRRLSTLRKNGALQPGKNPGARGTRQRLGRTWSFRVHQRRDHQIHDSKTFWRRGQEDADFHSVFDGGW